MSKVETVVKETFYWNQYDCVVLLGTFRDWRQIRMDSSHSIFKIENPVKREESCYAEEQKCPK